jgi:hypothetical protein
MLEQAGHTRPKSLKGLISPLATGGNALWAKRCASDIVAAALLERTGHMMDPAGHLKMACFQG